MSIVAEHFSFVVGVDTHARSNTYAIIATRTAARLDAAEGPAVFGPVLMLLTLT